MTNRKSIANSWATDVAAEVTDAEVDVDHPNGYGGPGKTATGWVSQTEPHQWENFNIKLREDRMKAVMQSGRMPWDEEVTYKVGALAYLVDVLYVGLLGGNLNKDPVTQTAYWSPVKFPTASIHTATIADMQNKFTIHTPVGQNSHNDDIVAIGGSVKTTIDDQIQVVDADLAAHKLLTNNPHNDTATGVGTVPIAGGSFTGQVNYRDNLVLGSDCELMTNATTFVNFRSNTGAIGLGIADYHLGGKWQQIMTAANFPTVNATYNPTFVMPEPDLHFPLMSNLAPMDSVVASLTFTRNATLEYIDKSNNAQTAAIDTPAFEVHGAKLTANTAMVVTAANLFGTRDGCISYTLDNVVFVKDVQFTNNNLMSYFGATTGNVKNFRVWSQRLTPRQKLSIPR